MEWKRDGAVVGMVMLAAVSLLLGCAGLRLPPGPAPAAPPVIDPSGAERGWWAVRFRFDWPQEAEPQWHLDPLVAHRVAGPVLERHRQEIPLWRFHRRAARDAAGHQFSLIFFADRRTAGRVNAEVLGDPMVQAAKTAGRLAAVVCDDPAVVLKPGVGDTSDPAWSPPLRDAWPYFLMGASRTWLELITRLAGAAPEPEGFAAAEERYLRLNSAVSAIWQREGRHAFLHHLNAVFGYEPVLIIDKRLMNF
jgi:hypothetical protein